MVVKRLLIRASPTYSGKFETVPVNGGELDLETDTGLYRISVGIKNFDGSQPHRLSSYYNKGDQKKLDLTEGKSDEASESDPNFRVQIVFTPKKDILGDQFIFGNDFVTPIKDYVPTSILSTGLKFYKWFISKSVEGDVYADKPYLYQTALNCFTLITLEGVKDSGKVLNYNRNVINYSEEINHDGEDDSSSHPIPRTSEARKKFYDKFDNTHHFTFRAGRSYILRFDTNYLKMGDSNYAISIPSFGKKTFDINVLRFANEKLDNVNFVLKEGGMKGVDEGKPLMVINFALRNEESEETTKQESKPLEE